MKQQSSITSVLLGLGLLMGVTSAAADPSVQAVIPQNQTATLGDLVGSDTLEDIALDVLAIGPAITADDGALAGRGIAAYNGLGSSAGQRQMIGNVTAAANPGEPTCLTNDPSVNGDANWGCQELAPMSRQMNSSICGSDADDPRDNDDSTTVNSTAEGLAICLDGISIVTDNASHRQYAADAAACTAFDAITGAGDPWAPSSDNSGGIPGINGYQTAGKIRNTAGALPAGSSGYQLGGLSGLAPWKDVLRQIYSGCDNVDRNSDGVITAADCSTSLTRASRCGAGNAARADIVNNYGNVFEGTDCGEANHCSQLRAAYRRDDASGTTGFFLDTLLLRSGTSDLAGRTRMATALANTCKASFFALPQNIFCDGGSHEGVWPEPYTGVCPASGTDPFIPGTHAVVWDVFAGTAVIGDPLQRTCAAEDDLCGPSGTVGLVRPIRTPRRDVATTAFPLVQCTRGAFLRRPWPSSGNVPTCPDGTVPTSLGCLAPYFNDTSTNPPTPNFDCLNTSNSRPGSFPSVAPTLDGRVFNFAWRLSNGDLSTANHTAQVVAGATMVEVAQWRQNAATMNTGALPAVVAGGLFGATQFTAQAYAASGDNAAFSKTFTGGKVCQNSSSTALIGCITSNTRCTIGFGGREAADEVNDPVFGAQATGDDRQEAANLGGVIPTDADLITGAYPIARSLFINAIGGFENIEEDCLARGGSAEYCSDEVEFARRFYDQVPGVTEACSSNGFIPITNPVDTCTTNADCAITGSIAGGTCVGGACTGAVHDSMQAKFDGRCVGTVGATGSSACGRVTSQPATRCDPDAASPEAAGGGEVCTTNYSPASGANGTCG